MTDHIPPPRPTATSSTAALVVLAVVFCFTLAVVAAVHILSPDGSDTTSLVSAIIGTLAPTLAVVVVLVQVRDVKALATSTAHDTHRLTNGLLDAKVRAGVADVMPHLVHPEAEALVDHDRRVRQAGDPDVSITGTGSGPIYADRPLTSSEVGDLKERWREGHPPDDDVVS